MSAPLVTEAMHAWVKDKVDDPARMPLLDRPWKVRDIADYLGVTVQTARAYRDQNRLPAADSRDGDPLGVWWWPATIISWDMARPTQGWRSGRTARR